MGTSHEIHRTTNFIAFVAAPKIIVYTFFYCCTTFAAPTRLWPRRWSDELFIEITFDRILKRLTRSVLDRQCLHIGGSLCVTFESL